MDLVPADRADTGTRLPQGQTSQDPPDTSIPQPAGGVNTESAREAPNDTPLNDAFYEVLGLDSEHGGGYPTDRDTPGTDPGATGGDPESNQMLESGVTPDFYIGPNGKAMPGQYKEWMGTNMQQEFLSRAVDPQLRNAIKQL